MSALALESEGGTLPPQEIGRWTTALLFVLAAHVLFVLFALSKHEPADSAAELPAAVLVELSASSPSDAALSELPPAPTQFAAPDAPAPIEDEPEEMAREALTKEMLKPVVEAPAETVHQAIAPPLSDMAHEDLEAAAEAGAAQIAEAVAVPLPDMLNPMELQPVAESAASPSPAAVAAPLPDMLVNDNLSPAAAAATETTTPQAVAESFPDLPGTFDLSMTAVAPPPTTPASASAAAMPDTLEPTIDARTLAATAVATSARTQTVEADPGALRSLTAETMRAPLPRPRPDILPEQRPVETEKPQRMRSPSTVQESRPTKRTTTPRRAAAMPPAPATTAPAAQPQRSSVAAAPQAGAPAAPSVSPDRWRSAVYRHLERYKRYPRSAESRGIGGTVRVRFGIDRDGNILSHRIAASSGHAELDDAVAALIARASPVPAPPPELYRSGMSIEVPIHFSRR